MPRSTAKGKKDVDKGKAELIKELDALRDHNSRLKDVVRRYERVVGKKDMLQSRYDAEAEKDSIESLRKKLCERQKEVDLQSEEVFVQNEELSLQIEEVNVRSEEIEKVNAALQKSEEMLRHIIDASPIPMVLYNESENYYFFNNKFHETFGYSSEDVPSINEWWLLAYPDDQYRELVKKRWYIAVDEAIHNRSSIVPQEAEVTCKDGSIKHVLGEFSSIGSMNLSVLYDITERRQAEVALRESEEKFRALAESAQAGIVLLRGDKFLYVNAQMIKMLGYTGEELLAMDFWDTIHPDNRELVRSRAQARFRDLPVPSTYEIKVVTRSGEILWAELSSAVIDYKGEPTIIATIFDVTKRKHADEALAFERSQLLSIFDGIDDVVYVSDPHTYEVLYANKAMKEMFGGDLVGGVCYREFQRRDSPCDFCTNAIILKEKGAPYRWEFYNPTVDRYFMITDRIIRWPDGRAVRFEIAKDITKRKRAEEELKKEKMQAELYLDLMGHDINNMHQIAMGYLEIVEGMIPADDPRRELLGKPTEVLQRSAQLIRNVRKLQKLREGVFQNLDVDVCALLVDLQREFGSVPHKAITLNLNGSESCHVRANELLHDVFANLVSNAIKHSGDKADIKIDLDSVKDKSSQYYRVSVEDDGPGIPDDFKDQVFNRLLKGTKKAKGMGLGLYLVKSLVDSYGGRVWVEDRVKGDHSKGARFVVMLPGVEK